jgi:hypothetical protein
VWPQVVPSDEHSLSGSVPDVTAAHLPLPAPVLELTQASQVPPQALLQQKPSAQNPLVHWLVPVQAPPLARFAVHIPVPVSQNEPLVQLASAVHVLGRQVVLLLMQTTPPGQGPVDAVPGTHVPAPSQAAGVVVSWLPVQEVDPVHGVVAGAKPHLPLPSQKPVAPQVVVPAEHSLSGSVLALIPTQ